MHVLIHEEAKQWIDALSAAELEDYRAGVKHLEERTHFPRILAMVNDTQVTDSSYLFPSGSVRIYYVLARTKDDYDVAIIRGVLRPSDKVVQK